jgi:dethiobiotin synthetase/adenosylmethionine--8-amino-7-oxononanoate aminotransferase
LKGIELTEGKKWEEERALWGQSERWSFWSEDFVKAVSGMESIKGSMAMGTVFAIELSAAEGGEPVICLSWTEGRSILQS